MSTAYEWKQKLALRVALSKNNIDKEAVTWGCSVKNVFLEIHRKTTVPKTCKFIKKQALAQEFSCEFCEISKSTYSYRAPLVAASLDSNSPSIIYAVFN